MVVLDAAGVLDRHPAPEPGDLGSLHSGARQQVHPHVVGLPFEVLTVGARSGGEPGGGQHAARVHAGCPREEDVGRQPQQAADGHVLLPVRQVSREVVGQFMGDDHLQFLVTLGEPQHAVRDVGRRAVRVGVDRIAFGEDDRVRADEVGNEFLNVRFAVALEPDGHRREGGRTGGELRKPPESLFDPRRPLVQPVAANVGEHVPGLDVGVVRRTAADHGRHGGQGSDAERAGNRRPFARLVASGRIEHETEAGRHPVTAEGGSVAPERPGQVGEALPALLLDLERKLLLDAPLPGERGLVRRRQAAAGRRTRR